MCAIMSSEVMRASVPTQTRLGDGLWTLPASELGIPPGFSYPLASCVCDCKPGIFLKVSLLPAYHSGQGKKKDICAIFSPQSPMSVSAVSAVKAQDNSLSPSSLYAIDQSIPPTSAAALCEPVISFYANLCSFRENDTPIVDPLPPDVDVVTRIVDEASALLQSSSSQSGWNCLMMLCDSLQRSDMKSASLAVCYQLCRAHYFIVQHSFLSHECPQHDCGICRWCTKRLSFAITTLSTYFPLDCDLLHIRGRVLLGNAYALQSCLSMRGGSRDWKAQGDCAKAEFDRAIATDGQQLMYYSFQKGRAFLRMTRTAMEMGESIEEVEPFCKLAHDLFDERGQELHNFCVQLQGKDRFGSFLHSWAEAKLRYMCLICSSYDEYDSFLQQMEDVLLVLNKTVTKDQQSDLDYMDTIIFAIHQQMAVRFDKMLYEDAVIVLSTRRRTKGEFEGIHLECQYGIEFLDDTFLLSVDLACTEFP